MVLPTTVQDIVRVKYQEEHFRIQGIRPDSLSLFMHLSNLHEDLDILVFDNTKGIILSSSMQKLDGKGIQIIRRKSFNTVPNYQIMQFPLEYNQCIHFQNMEVIKNQKDKFSRLLIGGHIQNIDILKQVYESLKSGCIVTIFCQFQEPLTECFEWMTDNKKFIMVQLQDVFTREHQVLDMRTHPLTQMESFSGYILSGIKTNPENI